ncbi:ribosomal protein l28 containing protein [Stylonychia lemnae]|uniref:Ribosomal protein l28 containing protein n=1 Tax=Stylonychia lemnae TaxID=5949 RepID=A0A078A2K0_STYLE|nr:ribosomal protein l28 containing protein [Stylonychia lemnae]|eukprot:CDW76047.1 ribosomal protein l28 containing protein [Stylonychia lemnae]
MLLSQQAMPMTQVSQRFFFTQKQQMDTLQKQQTQSMAQSMLLLQNQSMRNFGALQKLMYKTDNNAKSGRYQKGLFHRKTHGRRFQRCFSMKKSIVTMKPNIKRKNLYSEALNKHFRMEISMKARKCIIKAGSLDKYLTSTSTKNIDSKFGLYLRELVIKKQKNPDFEVPYIPGTAKLPKTKKTSAWEYRQIPAIYMPVKARLSDDMSKYYAKTPQEMSRYEISQLEQMLKELDEPEKFFPDEYVFASQEYADLKEEMMKLQPIRHGVFKRYLEQYKYQKKKRETLLRAMEESEEVVKDVLRDDYVHFLDAVPEIRKFLGEVEALEAAGEQRKLEEKKLEEEREADESIIKHKKFINIKKLTKKQQKDLAKSKSTNRRILDEEIPEEQQKEEEKENEKDSEEEEEEEEEKKELKKKKDSVHKAQTIKEVPFNPLTFNPFDPENIKKDDAIKRRLLQPKRVYKEVDLEELEKLNNSTPSSPLSAKKEAANAKLDGQESLIPGKRVSKQTKGSKKQKSNSKKTKAKEGGRDDE